MACEPKCFKCRLEMISRPVAWEFLAAFKAAMGVTVVNCVGMVVFSVSL